MGDKVLRLKKHVGSKARIIYPYTITNTGFSDIGLYKRFPYHKTFLEPFVGGWSVVLNHPCWEQAKWNTRTLPVIAVNDLDKGIIDLAWCLLYIPYHFKMAVKNAIHCEGLWEETKDKALLDRFRSSLRKYYDIEADYHEHPDFANGLRDSYQNEASYGGTRKGVWIRTNMNRQAYQQLKDVPAKDIEDGLSHFYTDEHAFGGGKCGSNHKKYFGNRINTSPTFNTDNIRDVDPVEIENGLREHYLADHAYDGGGKSFRVIKDKEKDNCERRSPVFTAKDGKDLNSPEEGLGCWYYKQHAFSGKNTFPFEVNKNLGSFNKHGQSDNLNNPEDGLRKHYKDNRSYNSIGQSYGVVVNKNKDNCERQSPYHNSNDKPNDYYDEIHTRLRWIQIFNKTYARFFKRFVGWKKGLPKMENGFIYLDPPYFKTIKGKHYEHNMTLEEHHELASWLYEADHQGVKFLLSYDVDERAEDLYSSFKFEKIQVPYSVARSYGDGRAQMDEEYLIMNYNYKHDNYYDQVDLTRKPKLDAFL